MAIGSRYNPGSVPNYIQMGEQSERNALQNAQGAANLFNTGMKTMHQIEDRARLEEARQAFDAAWMSKDPDDIQRVIARFPEYAAKIQQSIGIRDDQQRQQVGSMAVQLSGMLESGNIQAAQDLIRQNARLFAPQGRFSAESVAAEIGRVGSGKDEESKRQFTQWKDWAKKLSLSSLTPKEILDYTHREARRLQDYELGKERNADYRERGRGYGGRLRSGLEKLSVRQQRAQELSDFYANPTRELANLIISGGTVDQRKSAEFASRMKKATDKMNSIISKGGISKAKLGEITRRLRDGTLASMALNSSEQLYVNAAMDIIRAQLRKESGASVSQNEWDTAFSHYLPTGADSEALMAEKQSLLTDLANSAIASSGGLFDAHEYLEREGRKTPPSVDTQSAGQSANGNAPPANRTPINVNSKRNPYTGEPIGPSVGDVVDGYRFMGGDPGNPDNWEEV